MMSEGKDARKHTLSFDISGLGHGIIELDGEEVQNVISGLEIKCEAGELSQVTLYLDGIRVEGQLKDALVRGVTRGERKDDG